MCDEDLDKLFPFTELMHCDNCVVFCSSELTHSMNCCFAHCRADTLPEVCCFCGVHLTHCLNCLVLHCVDFTHCQNCAVLCSAELTLWAVTASVALTSALKVMGKHCLMMINLTFIINCMYLFSVVEHDFLFLFAILICW